MSTANASPEATQTAVNSAETSLLDEILAETRLQKSDEAYEATNLGIRAFLRDLLKGEAPIERVDKSAVDASIAAIDETLSKLLDAVIHAPEFQKREATWRGLKFLVDRTDFRENVRIRILNASKDDLLADFEEWPDVSKSGLYRTVYSAEYGTLGGKPYAGIFANYELSPTPQDLLLLEKCSAVAAMAHSPFIAAAGPKFFGLSDSLGLPKMKDLDALFEGPVYAKWRALRENPDTIYTGLVVRRFELRLPYGSSTIPAKTFQYEESISSHEDYLWGNATFMLASILTASFGKYRWCANIIGPNAGGAVDGLPLHLYKHMGADQIKVPTEVSLTERLEYELSEQGFIAPTYEKGTDRAVFFSANSIHKPKRFANTPEGKDAEANYKLGCQLPYLFISTRIAHYLKMIGRGALGRSLGRSEIERELNAWVSQYVSDTEAPTPETLARRPLKRAQVTVTDIAGEPGWYKYGFKFQPHLKNMGAVMELSLVGKLDKVA